MKIHRLSIKNFLGIASAEITPGGQSQLITGGNARGKSSILKAIQAGVEGTTDASVIHREPGTDGAAYAEILIELDEISIERAIGADGKQTVEVRTVPDRVKVSKPQTYLREISNVLAFNPVQFFFQSPKDKRETLLRVMPLRVTREEIEQAVTNALHDGIDPAQLTAELHRFMATNPDVRRIDMTRHALEVLAKFHAAAYDVRHAIGTEVKNKRSILEGATMSAPPVDYDEKEHEQKLAEMKRADEHRVRKGELIESQKRIGDDIAETARKIRELEDDLEDRKRAFQETGRMLEEHDAHADANLDEHCLRNRVMALQTLKTLHDAHLQAEEKLSKVRGEETALSLRREIYQLMCEVLGTALPAQKLAEAKLPVPDLAVTDEGVLVSGKPIEHLSGAEQMSVAIAVAEGSIPSGGMAVMCIDGAERLDAEQFVVLEARLSRGDIQGFVTRVTSGERKIETIGDGDASS